MEKTEIIKIEKRILKKKEDPKALYLIKEFRKSNQQLRAYIGEQINKNPKDLTPNEIKLFIKENRKINKQLKILIKRRKNAYDQRIKYLATNY